MKDPVPAKEKSASKAGEGSGEGKKKFEVKKVQLPIYSIQAYETNRAFT